MASPDCAWGGSEPTWDHRCRVRCACGWEAVFDKDAQFPYAWDAWRAHEVGTWPSPAGHRIKTPEHHFKGSGPVSNGKVWLSCGCGWSATFNVGEGYATSIEAWEAHRQGTFVASTPRVPLSFSSADPDTGTGVGLHYWQGAGYDSDGAGPYTYCTCGWKKGIRRLTHGRSYWEGHAGNHGKLRAPKAKATKAPATKTKFHWGSYGWSADADEISALAVDLLGGDYWISADHEEDDPEPADELLT